MRITRKGIYRDCGVTRLIEDYDEYTVTVSHTQRLNDIPTISLDVASDRQFSQDSSYYYSLEFSISEFFSIANHIPGNVLFSWLSKFARSERINADLREFLIAIEMAYSMREEMKNRKLRGNNSIDIPDSVRNAIDDSQSDAIEEFVRLMAAQMVTNLPTDHGPT